MYYRNTMAVNNRNTKRVGRPPTGHDPVISVRLPAQLVQTLAACADAEETPRSEVIRIALTEHLKAKGYLK